jgi:uncharacterized protein
MNPLLTPPDPFIEWFKVFVATFAGLAFETLPFLLIGSFLSAIIVVFVPSGFLRRLFPRNRYLSILAALGVGVFLPVCECAVVPLARRLRDEGLPESSALAFLLAAPLVNPMTIVTTFVAFQGAPIPVFAYRLGAGLLSAFVVALAVELIGRLSVGRVTARVAAALGASGAPLRGHLGAVSAPRRVAETGMPSRLLALAQRTSDDFFDSARFLIAGIAAAAALRALIPQQSLGTRLLAPLAAVGTGTVSAYLLSLCSSADAFVARSLFAYQSYLATLSFLVLGPMIDVKNTLLLSRFVKPRRLLVLVALVFAVSGSVCLLCFGLWRIGP